MSSHNKIDKFVYPFGKSKICNLEKIVDSFLGPSSKEITVYNTTSGCLELSLSKKHKVKSIINNNHLYLNFWKCVVEDSVYFSEVLTNTFGNFDPADVTSFTKLAPNAIDKYAKSSFFYIIKNCCVMNENGSYDLSGEFNAHETVQKIIAIKDLPPNNVTFYKEKPQDNKSDLFFYINYDDGLPTCLELCSMYDNWFLLTDPHKINPKYIKNEKILLLDEQYLITKELEKCKKCLIFSTKT